MQGCILSSNLIRSFRALYSKCENRDGTLYKVNDKIFVNNILWFIFTFQFQLLLLSFYKDQSNPCPRSLDPYTD